MMDMDELFEHLNEVGLKPVYIDEDTGWLLEQIDDAQLREGMRAYEGDQE